MKSIDTLNFNKHLCMRSQQEMLQLIKPLQKYGISHFSFSKIHRDGCTEILTTDPDVSAMFYDMQGWQHAYCGDVDSYFDCVALWDDIDNGSQFATDYMSSMAESYNVAHGLVIVKKRQDSVEFYYFATTRHNQAIRSFYLNNLDVCESFVQYFNDATDLLKQSFRERFYVPDGNEQTLIISPELQTYCHGVPTKAQAKHVSHMLEFYQLSQREVQCIERLIAGDTTKQIASSLEISPRTVEKFIANIEYKTNTKTLYHAMIKLMY